MGETEFRGNIMQGDGVYKTADGGKTWTHLGPRATRRPSRASASIRPTPTSSMWPRSAIPTERTRSAASSSRRTAARRGRRSLYRDDQTPARSISPSIRSNPNVIFAAMWDANRTPVEPLERRPGQRTLQVHRWRRHLDRDHAQSGTAARADRQDRRRRCRQPTAIASTRSSRTKRAACSCPTTPARAGS